MLSLSACGEKKDPEPTATPEVSAAPQETEAPKATEMPKPTEAPKPTETPKPTEAPKPTVTPAPVQPGAVDWDTGNDSYFDDNIWFFDENELPLIPA